jgi:hypothetical protein
MAMAAMAKKLIQATKILQVFMNTASLSIG